MRGIVKPLSENKEDKVFVNPLGVAVTNTKVGGGMSKATAPVTQKLDNVTGDGSVITKFLSGTNEFIIQSFKNVANKLVGEKEEKK
jgi:hypothetical protein